MAACDAIWSISLCRYLIRYTWRSSRISSKLLASLGQADFWQVVHLDSFCMLQVIILDQLLVPCFRQVAYKLCFRFITLGFFRVFGMLLYLACFRFSASCKLHASGFRQVACFRFSASCMLQVFGKLLYLGKLHASGFQQVAILGQVACFRVISASCYTWASCMLQGDFGKVITLG